MPLVLPRHWLSLACDFSDFAGFTSVGISMPVSVTAKKLPFSPHVQQGNSADFEPAFFWICLLSPSAGHGTIRTDTEVEVGFLRFVLGWHDQHFYWKRSCQLLRAMSKDCRSICSKINAGGAQHPHPTSRGSSPQPRKRASSQKRKTRILCRLSQSKLPLPLQLALTVGHCLKKRSVSGKRCHAKSRPLPDPLDLEVGVRMTRDSVDSFTT